MGLVIEKNLATHVNDEEFIRQYRDTLSEASCRSFDKVIEKCPINWIYKSTSIFTLDRMNYL